MSRLPVVRGRRGRRLGSLSEAGQVLVRLFVHGLEQLGALWIIKNMQHVL